MPNCYYEYLKRMVKKVGPWSGVRWMRNQGVSFEHAYFVMFDRQPS